MSASVEYSVLNECPALFEDIKKKVRNGTCTLSEYTIRMVAGQSGGKFIL